MLSKVVLFCVCLFSLNADLHEKIDQLVKSYAAKQGGGGMAVHVVYPEDGRMVMADFFHGQEGPTETSIEYIASITKVFTTTALAQFVKDGRIRLTDLAQKYVPASVKVPSFRGKQITISDLATHTSGLPEVNNVTTPFHYELDQFYEFLNQAKLSYAPGTKYKYSNSGFEFLGVILSNVAGKSYEDVIEDVVCNPLGMKDTCLSPSLTEDQLARQVKYFKGSKMVDVVCCAKLPALGGGGALMSSLADMSIFLHFNMGLMKTRMNDLLPTLQKTYFHKEGKEYIDLGWFNYPLERNVQYLWKDGGLEGVKTYIAFVKKSKTGVVALANNSEAKPGQLAQAILKLLNPEK